MVEYIGGTAEFVSAGFTDQSQFSHHFSRRAGVALGQFRMSARIA
jgi:AraC-like DNA-binding protein